MKFIISNQRIWAGGLSLLLLSGCSFLPATSQPSNITAEQSVSDRTLLPQETGVLLSANQSGFTTVLESTKQTLTAQATYFSASNKVCRSIQISESERQKGQAYIACQISADQWQLNNPLP